MTLGKYLKSLREANSLTLRGVEQKTGVSNALLSQIESGKVKKPSPIMLYKLAELYGVSYEDLMKRTGYPVPNEKIANIHNRNTVFHRLGNLTKEEEESLLEYLSFLRSRSEKGSGKK